MLNVTFPYLHFLQHANAEVLSKARAQRKAKVRQEFTAFINKENARLQAAIDKRAAERRSKLQEALQELSEAEAALKSALADANSRLSSESNAVDAAFSDLEKLLDRKGTELQGVASATLKQLGEVTQNRAQAQMDAMQSEMFKAVESTKLQVAEMCIRVEVGEVTT